MEFEKFNRIVDVMDVKLVTAKFREIQQPLSLPGVRLPFNLLVQSRRGCVWTGPEKKFLNNNDFYFIPLGRQAVLNYGIGAPFYTLKEEDSVNMEIIDNLMKPVTRTQCDESQAESVCGVTFNTLALDSIPIFKVMDLPPVLIPYNRRLNNLVNSLVEEANSQHLGKQSMISLLLKEAVIIILRHLYSKKEFEENFSKMNFLMDPRLEKIIGFIQDNLGSELSNEKIAQVANISKDYVGQFFKSVTGRNLQDFIESRRLEKAHLILRTIGGNIHDVSKGVGFRDQAYFSKRFKMMFKVNAKDVRKIKEQSIV